MQTAGKIAVVLAGVVLASTFALGQKSTGAVGVFEGQTDIGAVNPPGTASFDAASGTYTVSSAGWDLWADHDAFHMVWKKMSGDFSLTTDLVLAPASPTSHVNRKAFIMLRQALTPESMYADVAVHNAGETALQYRASQGDSTQDIFFNQGAPKTIRLEKRGDTISFFISLKGEPLHQTGASIKLHFAEPFYVGLGVCSHRDGAPEKATFAHLELKPLTTPENSAAKAVYSTLKTIDITESYRRAHMVLTAKGQMEAPVWTKDGKMLIFDRDGKLWSVPAAGGDAAVIDTGDAVGCTGSHGLSPDSKWLAATCGTTSDKGKRVYVFPVTGGTPRLVTANPNSWFHSWSPDGKTILFTRPSNGSLNIMAIAAEGGDEKPLTTGTGTSDDPDYSPDGQWVYFNSDRAGGMQIFRMKPDGSNVEQMTFDDRASWTPHPSPDGKVVLFLSYGKGVTGHPANKDVTLRLLDPATKKIRDLTEITGGGGTDNVNNWAPDGTHFAFVSYQMLPPEDDGASE